MLSVIDFVEKHNLNKNTVLQYVYKKPTLVFVKKIDGTYYIDEKYIYKAKQFKSDTINKAHSLYFIMSDELKLGDWKIATLLAKHTKRSVENWESFLSQYLFKMSDRGFFDFKTPKRMIDFVKHSEQIIKGINNG